MSNDDTLRRLLNGGAKTLAFPTIGTVWTGTITEVGVERARDFNTGEPKFFPKSGDPIMEVVVTLQTDVRDEDSPDGVRRLFCNSKAKLLAVRAALKAAGARELQPGGRLGIAYTGDGAPEKAGQNAPKLFEAQYQPPARATAVDLLGSAPPPAAAVPQQAPPAQQLPTSFPDPTPLAPRVNPFG